MIDNLKIQALKNRRFIAGASCPRCGDIDKIFVAEVEGEKWRGCVSCGFTEQFTDMQQRSLEEVPTRVNQPRMGEQVLSHETPVEAINIVGIANPKKTDN